MPYVATPLRAREPVRSVTAAVLHAGSSRSVRVVASALRPGGSVRAVATALLPAEFADANSEAHRSVSGVSSNVRYEGLSTVATARPFPAQSRIATRRMAGGCQR